jgi:hypothetical protein
MQGINEQSVAVIAFFRQTTEKKSALVYVNNFGGVHYDQTFCEKIAQFCLKIAQNGLLHT